MDVVRRGTFGALKSFTWWTERSSAKTARRHAEAEKISLSAKVVDGNRELPWGGVRFVVEQNLFVGFGHRAKPVELSHRHGGYPHDAVFLGFIVFDG